MKGLLLSIISFSAQHCVQIFNTSRYAHISLSTGVADPLLVGYEECLLSNDAKACMNGQLE